jgi:hypothetical protein
MEEKTKKVYKPKPEGHKASYKNRRIKGGNFEREIVNDLKELGYEKAATSRRMSRALDDAKVDIYGVPYNIQAKFVEKPINYKDLLEEVNSEITKQMPERLQYPTLIFHKRNRTSLVIMSKADFYQIIKQLPK